MSPPFRVLWLHELTRDVIPEYARRLTVVSPDRVLELGTATVRLEAYLSVAAEEMGESRAYEDVRVTVVRPLAVDYQIFRAPRVVVITGVRLYPGL